MTLPYYDKRRKLRTARGGVFLQAVILAGGLGTRMREETEYRPKPLVEIGGKPVLWHIMKNLSAQGITEFIILTGYKGEMIRRYFLDLPAINNDFTISYAQNRLTYHNDRKEEEWTVTVLETGPETLTAGRLAYAKAHIRSSTFLLTYGDGLADVDLSKLSETHSKRGLPFTITVAVPSSRFGVVQLASSGEVETFIEKPKGAENVNIGFMLLESNIFDYLSADEPLETGPLPRLASQGLLGAYVHSGFFHPMDTVRDQHEIEALWKSGNAPWVNWTS